MTCFNTKVYFWTLQPSKVQFLDFESIFQKINEK